MKSNSPISEFDPAIYERVPINSLRPNPRNARTHSKKQVREIASCVQGVGFINPLIADENGTVLAGHGRLEAAKLLGMTTVPVLRFGNLNEAQKRAYALADNKLSEKAGWDHEILAIELGDLAVLLPEFNFDLTITGFEIGEIDGIINDRAKEPAPKSDEIDDGEIPALSKRPVTRRGDMFVLGPHRLLCGDARSMADIDLLMQGDRARMAFLDPPYNVRVQGHVGGRGAIQHEEFAFASGEMSSTEFTTFLGESLGQAARVSIDGALHYVAMDWRHLQELFTAGKDCYSAQLNLCVWAKTSPGQGSFYRSQHELISVFKVGEAPHRNGVELGRHGRSRSNVWSYPGASSFKAGGLEELAWHPTVKPVAMVADAMRDCTMKGEIVLDTFLGSGTTLVAAERIGRVCRGIEYEPKYVDVAIQRWQAWTKLEAICAATGKTFDEIAAERSASTDTDVADGSDPAIFSIADPNENAKSEVIQ